MKVNFVFHLVFIFVFISCQPKESTNSEIWYDEPAKEWIEALPVGNGRMGAMVFGDYKHERIQLNEDSMWPGAADFGDSKGSPADLATLREMLDNGENEKADSFIVDKFSYQAVNRSHQTMGDLFLDFEIEGEVSNYRRSLYFNDAIVIVEYDLGGYHYTEKVFSSNPDDVLVIQLSTDNPEGLTFTAALSRPQDDGHPTAKTTAITQNTLSMTGTVTQYRGVKENMPFPLDYGVSFETILQARIDEGSIANSDNSLKISNAKTAQLNIVSATSFYQEDYKAANKKTLTAIDGKGFDQLFERHSNDFRNYFDRVSFKLGGNELDSIPTNHRLTRMEDGHPDNGLAVKLFEYGRYLLISSSRPGTNPANLQGIWNEHIEAPWNADYHLNINLQMNYWPAEVTNLSELHGPLFEFMDRVYVRGSTLAKAQYGINRGTMAHHTTDLWAPAWMRAARPYWGSWIHGGGWLGQHYWTHYQFTRDENFLSQRTYPTLKKLSEFYMDWLVEDPESGYLISSPETSPENSYIDENGRNSAVSRGAAMGHQIIGEVFDNTLESAGILGIDDAFISELKDKRKRLHPGVLIGEDGRILEWNKPYDEPEKGHRHMSHLYALYPGDDIVASDTAAFKAAKKSINYRLEYGGAGTGWSRAWMISFNARLLDKQATEENINKLITISTAPNLFNLHPPFQIDGNFGFTAGVAEALLQSHEGFIRILPALPPGWEDGEIKGLKARGNYTVDISWENGKLTRLALTSVEMGKVHVVYNDFEKELTMSAGETVVLNNTLKVL